MSGKTILAIQNFLKRVWIEEDATAIKELYVPYSDSDAKKAHGLSKDGAISPEEFEQFHSLILSLIKEINFIYEDIMEVDNHASIRLTMTCKRRDGKNDDIVSIKGCLFGEVSDGKIRVAYNYFDFLHLFEALGLLPENTMVKCLTGEGVMN